MAAKKGNDYALKFTAAKKKIYLGEMERTRAPYKAARAAGITYQTVVAHRKKYPEFKTAEEEAKQVFLEGLEGEAYRRGVVGITRRQFHQGKTIMDEKKSEPIMLREFSDGLLTTLLKANAPEKYRENVKMEADFKGGALVVPGTISPEDWEKRERERMKREEKERA